MKAFKIIAIAATLSSGTCYSAPKPNHFDALSKAIEEAVVYHFTKTAGSGPFSITLDNPPYMSNGGNRVSLPVEITKRLEMRAPILWRGYMDPADLRFPRFNEKDPKDKTGQTDRGFETKSGAHVRVLEMTGIKYVSPTKILMDWKYHGSKIYFDSNGTYEVNRSHKSWIVADVSPPRIVIRCEFK